MKQAGRLEEAAGDQLVPFEHVLFLITPPRDFWMPPAHQLKKKMEKGGS